MFVGLCWDIILAHKFNPTSTDFGDEMETNTLTLVASGDDGSQGGGDDCRWANGKFLFVSISNSILLPINITSLLCTSSTLSPNDHFQSFFHRTLLIVGRYFLHDDLGIWRSSLQLVVHRCKYITFV